MGVWSFLSGPSVGEDQLLLQIRSSGLLVLTGCLGKACFGEGLLMFLVLMQTKAIS